MAFFLQLKLLSWKNYTTKRRNKLRLAIEVVMPVILFLVLMFLRRIGDKKILPDCYFKPKAMPSAGDLAFYQSLYCSLNNTCDNSVVNASLSTYNESIVSSLMHALEVSFDLDPGEKSQSSQSTFIGNMRNIQINKFLAVMKNAVEADEELKKTDLGTIFSSVSFSNERRRFTCGIQLEPIQSNKKKRAIADSEQNSFPKESESESSYENATYFSEPKNISVVTMDDLANSSVLKALDEFLCGPNVPSLLKQFQSISGQTESTWERKKEEIETQSVSTKPKRIEFEECNYENDTSEFCNDLMCSVDQSLETRFIWRMFKPFVRGKIVYTPDAPVTRRIMGRIHDALARGKKIIEELTIALRILPGLEELKIIRRKDDFLRSFLSTEVGQEILRVFQGNRESNLSSADKQEEDLKAMKNVIDRSIIMYQTMSPGSPRFDASKILKFAECVDWQRTMPVSNPEDAVDASMQLMKSERLWALIEFVNISSNATELPTSVTYKIRTGIERTHATFQIRDRVYRPRVRRDPFIDLKHITGGWAYIQNLVESEIIREQTGREKVPGIYLQQTPYPCHIKDMFRESITRTFPMFMIVSWIFLFSMLVKKIVWEKEKRVTQTLSIMGIEKCTHWAAWFLDAFIPMFVVSILLATILVFGKIVPFSSFIVVWMFLVAFIFPTIALAFLMSTLFHKASVAAAVSGLMFLLIYLPYPPISQFEERLDPDLKVSLCLISNIAFGLGCTWLANMEELGWGGHLSNINVSPVPGNPIRMTLILGILILDAVIYFLAALYIENVFPGDDGVGKPFYFFLTKDFWLRKGRHSSITSPFKDREDPEKFEMEPEDLPIGVSVQNVSKRFGSKIALNNLCINFYEDQITSFLGHNGAGKSTAISIMTGLIAPTNGCVKIYERNMNTNDSTGNNEIGICSQENVLFEDLTVEEHLYFFARLKTSSEEEAKESAYEMMKEVGVLQKRHTVTKHLSGGTQRKVCVASAFIGKSKVVFLDEPTAGVDPASRRAIWDLLIKYKKGRTVVLTTHFMDEADLLGDRIAIIARGSVVCCGSSVFLKTKLGSGYYLTIDCDTRSDSVGRSLRNENTSETSSVLKLTEVLQNVLPQINFLEQLGSEITYVIPSGSDVVVYDQLFAALEKNKASLHISSFGISDTSLEEIFLKIAEEADISNGDAPMDNDDMCSCFRFTRSPVYNSVRDTDHGLPHGHLPDFNDVEVYEQQKLSAFDKIILQFYALLIKRALHHCRNYTIIVVEIILPTCFIAISLYLASILPSVQKMPPLAVDITAYAPSHIFYSLDKPDDPLLRSYERALLSQYGLGTKCVVNAEKCTRNSIPLGSIAKTDNEPTDATPCPCNEGRYSCPKSPPSPPWTIMSSGDRLYNLTGQNITDWVVKTELADSYIRYGGISMGYQRIFNSIGLLDLVQIFQIKQLLPLLSTLSTDAAPRNRAENTTIPMSTLISAVMMACSKPVASKVLENADINDNIIIWYNNRGWISGIAFMNAVSNMVLRASLPSEKNPASYSISLINHPLPISSRQFEDEIDKQSNISLLRALAVIWALAFIPATYAVYIISERFSGLKQLQLISGVRRWIYWISGLVWDLACFSVTIILIILIFLIYHESAYIQKASIGAFILLLISYGFVSVTFVYPISFLFTVPSTGFVAISTGNIFIGMFTLLTTFVLGLITEDDNPYYLNTIFLIFPQFCLGRALLNMSITFIRVKTLANFGVKDYPDYFDWDITFKFIVIMLVMGCLFLVLTLLIEYKFFCDSDNRKNELVSTLDDEDEDVQCERDRVLSGLAKSEGDILLLENLCKKYKREKHPAVDNLCLGVKGGECFGLLGLNGAGKTTVFKMLTGAIKPTSGDATILGESILHNADERPMGYCPQTNALDYYLNAAEHLAFFGRLRGISGLPLRRLISRNILKLGLEMHQNKISSALSGGNKRKLNTAIALVGDPRVILLDEPTSGMDPRARRFLWQCVQSCVREGRCVLLTSHSMEECQSLCSRLGILVNGRFKCIGSCQHLKSKFDEGYSVTVRSRSVQSVNEIKTYLKNHLPVAGDVAINYLQVKMSLEPRVSLGLVFSVLDNMKTQGLIRDYSINQTTLEQIFIKFAERQEQSASKSERMRFSKYFYCCQRKSSSSEERSSIPSVPTEVLVQQLSDNEGTVDVYAGDISETSPTSAEVRCLT